VPTPFAFRTVAALAMVAFLAGCLAAVANAQDAGPAPQRTLVSSGTGTVLVKPKDANDNASIVAAVKAAEAKALPAALTDAKTEAAALAAAAGLTLGTLVSIANAASNGAPFYGPFFSSYGSFGPDKYCGTVRSRPSTIGKDGKRHYGKVRSRRVCRVPTSVQRAVQLTYALA
jgi:uncharacterized protein YggE